MEQLTPLTREEEVLNTLLQAANGEAVEDLNPEWRKEQWFQNILDAIKGNELTYDLISEWRREDWYQAFIDAIQEGGGGGSVPEYTGSYTVTPSTSAQTLETDGLKMTDDVTIQAVPTGTAGTPTATKGAVLNHSVDVTPSVTNVSGLITGGTINGTPVTVTVAELESGTKSITQNGTDIDVSGYSTVDVNVSGGGVVEAPMEDVNFYDYDGTRLYSYTAAEFLALTEMPANPTHSGLTAQGWNWTLADAKEQVTAMGAADIGQMYITDSGDTEIYIEILPGGLSISLTISVNGKVTVSWGDGYSDVLSGYSLTSPITKNHTYSNPGNKKIILHADSGEYSFYEAQYKPLISKGESEYNKNRSAVGSVKEIRIGSNVHIGNYAFCGLFELQKITIPRHIESIGQRAFQDCIALPIVIIPKETEDVNASIVSGLRFAKISLPKSVVDLSYALNSANIPRIIIPHSAESVSCMDNFNLLQINLPDGLTSIGSYYFSNCYSLSTIKIPQSVVNILSSAFSKCLCLSEIHFEAATPPTVANSNAWTSLPTTCKIYVPTGSLSAYTSATNYPSASTYTYVEE